jgi:alpha-glucoside transport system substrate-binding protein
MRGMTLTKATAAAAGVALLTSGCLSSGPSTSGGDSGATTAKPEVSIMFGFGGDQTQGFKDSLDPWAKTNNIKIKYIQASSFDTLIRSSVAGNNAPDIALFPQPGLLKDLQKQGKLQALDDIVDMKKLDASIVPGFMDAAAVGGKRYGVPVSMNIKSLVFYNKPVFTAAGYQVPTTVAELIALSDKIKASGKTPWCVGLESGAATGWPGTDWIEELVLKQSGPEVYDKWVNGEVKFSDPQIKAAFETYAKLTLAAGNTFGGQKSIVSTAFSAAMNPMFTTPPGCSLHKQGNFVTQKGFLPNAVWSKIDTSVGVFPFPKDKFDTVEGGGDIAALFTKNDTNVTKVLKEMTENPKFGTEWAGPGDRGFLSPHKDFDVSKYSNETTRTIAKIAYTATGIRFDGSDSMPAKVGAGSFWKGMVAFSSGQQDLDETLKAIDATFPKTK